MVRILGLFIVVLCFGGCESPRGPLRFDDVMFGNKRVGLTSEKPSFYPGEEFYFYYAQRGSTPDKNGDAIVSISAKLSHEAEPFTQVTEGKYHINSEITSFGPRKPGLHRIPKNVRGEGTLVVKVTDHVANQTFEKTLPYVVKEVEVPYRR